MDAAVVELMATTGVSGARMTGGGFGGSAIALVRDADLATLNGLLESDRRPTWVIVAPGSLVAWDLDFTTAQAVLDADYDEVDTAGKFTIYRRHG